MGGRKGYSLKTIVGDLRKIRSTQRELLQGVQDKDPKKVVKASAKILAKSDKALDSIGYGYLFIDSLSNKYKDLQKKSTKKRRKQLAKKWASFRKAKGKKFDSATNRDVVDSTTRVLGGTK